MAEAAYTLGPDFHIDTSHLITEDDAPLDNPFQERQQSLLTDALYASWTDCESFVAFKNVGLFGSINEKAVVPDVMLTLDVAARPAESRAYFVWEYGRPPDLVVEIVSKTPGGEEALKKQRYAQMGVPYYVVYDPFGYLGNRPLRAYQKHGVGYIDVANPTSLPELKLGLTIWKGSYQGLEGKFLRFLDSAGELLATGQERAERESQRAERESQRAERESQRAERLAQKLRELGVDPDLSP
ncbi:MAG: Uma2 family endonuclease [Vulcanimicrobiota bacterium]